MEQHTLENVNNYLNTNVYSYLETSGVQSYYIYIEMYFIFSTPVLIRHLWQLKTVVFVHWYLICTVLLAKLPPNFPWLLHLSFTVYVTTLFFVSSTVWKKV